MKHKETGGEQPVKQRSFFWTVLAVCLAFLFGIIATIGGLIGGVFAVGSMVSVKSLPISEYITEDKRNMTLIDLISEVVSKFSDENTREQLMSLGGIGEYTTFVDTTLGEVRTQLANLGIELTDENIAELKSTKFTEMGTFLNNFVRTLEVGKVLKLKQGSEQLFLNICYGVEGVDFHFDENGEVVVDNKDAALTLNAIADGTSALLDKVTLGTALNLGSNATEERIKANAMLYAICYGVYGEDYTVENGFVKMADGKKAVSISDITGGTTDFVNGLRLGSLLGIDLGVEEQDAEKNAMMFALCYGTLGIDFEIENGKIEMIGDRAPTTIGDLTSDSTEFINGMQLASLIGLKTSGLTEADIENNSLMYAICFGALGEDYNLNGGKIEMTEGHTPTAIGDLTTNSTDFIHGMQLASLIGLKTSGLTDADIENNSLMYAICFGALGEDYNLNGGKIEMIAGHKAATVGDLTTNSTEFMDGLQVASLLGLKTSDLTEEELSGNMTLYALCFGARGEDYELTDGKIVMKDGKKPKTVKDLTESSSELIESLKIGDLIGVDETSSGLMQAIADWTIGDLSDQSMIESLSIGQLLQVEEGDSNLLQALSDKTIADLKKQETIESLKIGDIIEIDDSTSGILQAFRDKSIADLKDQETIESLKIGDIIEIDDSTSGILKALRGKTIADLKDQNTIESLKIGDIIEIGDESSALMKALKTWSIGDLGNAKRIERLKLKAVVGEGDSNLLKAIGDWSVGDLSKQEKFDSLSLKDILTINEESPALLRALENKTLGELSKDIDKLTLEEVLGADAFGEDCSLILVALRYTPVNGLADAIGTLSIEDVFGDEIWSYAEHYDRNTRPEKSYKGDEVERYYTTKSGKELTKGYYYSSEGQELPIPHEWTVKNNSYAEVRRDLVAEVSYFEINYETDSETPYTGGNVQEDPYTGFYYEDEDGVRHDLREEYTYKYNGAPIPENTRVYRDEDGERFYMLEKIEVFERFTDGEHTYEPESEEVTLKFRLTDGGNEVTRYLSGVWYLLLAKDTDGEIEYLTDTPVTRLASQVTGVAEKINSMSLGEMYNRELISSEPDIDISKLTALIGDPLDRFHNLNELTISDIIKLIDGIAKLPILNM